VGKAADSRRGREGEEYAFEIGLRHSSRDFKEIG
jgi:hypothetical protein